MRLKRDKKPSMKKKSYQKTGFIAAGLIFALSFPFSAVQAADFQERTSLEAYFLPQIVETDAAKVQERSKNASTKADKETAKKTASGRAFATKVAFNDGKTTLALEDKKALDETLVLLESAFQQELIDGDFAQTKKPRIPLTDTGAQAQGLLHTKAEQPKIKPGRYQVLDFAMAENYEKNTGLVPKAEVISPEEAMQIILKGRGISSSYTVEVGEKLESVLEATGLSKERLAALNPEKDMDKLTDGMILNTERFEPLVATETTLSYRGEIYEPYEVEFVDDANMMVGQYKVSQQGEYGISKVNQNLYFDGRRLSGVKVLEKKALKAPVKAVIHRGTAKEEMIQWPMEGIITSPFGERTWEDGTTEFHRGIDIANNMGMPIGAALGGTVIFAGEMGTYGNVVFIDHGNGLETRYAHLSEIQVVEGEFVDQLECIGLCGSTGNSTGPHLHFETIYHGELIDPLRFLPE